MGILQAAVLGAVQGFTELVPVSSSAHLALVPALLGWPKPSVPFAVAVHVGTAAALMVYFRRDLSALVIGACKWLRSRERFQQRGQDEQDSVRLLLLLLLATAPAAIVGPLAEDAVEAAFSSPTTVGAFLLVTAAILVVSERLSRGEEGRSETTWKDALWIGLAQVAALAPGISRSGATIAAGIALGLQPAAAVRFAFLMSIPVILGGGIFEAARLLREGLSESELGSYLVGALAAGACAWVAIVLVFGAVRRGKLSYYAFYCVLIGIIALAAGVIHRVTLR